MNKFVEFFDLGNVLGKATIKLVDGANPVVQLRRIDDMLTESKEMFEDHKAITPAGSRNSFIIRYRRLKTDTVTLKQQLRNNRRLGSCTRSDDTKEFGQKVDMLYDSVETFHEDVLQASQRAQQREYDDLFADLDYEQPAPSTPTQEGWASGSPRGTQSSTLESETSTLVSSHIRTLANFGSSAPSFPTGEGKRQCRAALYFETEDDQVLAIDSMLIDLDQDEHGVAETQARIKVMVSKCVDVLRTRSLQSIEGSSACTEQDMQWVDSITRKMSMMGLGMGVINSVPPSVTGPSGHT